MTDATGFCTHCGHRIEDFAGLDSCPKCGTTGVPCADEDQVTVSINWHELRILVIWAENYQRQNAESCGRVVYTIAKRLAAQHPELAARIPLTLAGELGQLVREFPGSDVSVSDPKLRRDIAEQTGQEPSLIRRPVDDDFKPGWFLEDEDR